MEHHLGFLYWLLAILVPALFRDQLKSLLWDKLIVPIWFKVVVPALHKLFSLNNSGRRLTNYEVGQTIGRLTQKVKDLETWKRDASRELKACAKDRVEYQKERAECQELRRDHTYLMMRVSRVEKRVP